MGQKNHIRNLYLKDVLGLHDLQRVNMVLFTAFTTHNRPQASHSNTGSQSFALFSWSVFQNWFPSFTSWPPLRFSWRPSDWPEPVNCRSSNRKLLNCEKFELLCNLNVSTRALQLPVSSTIASHPEREGRRQGRFTTPLTRSEAKPTTEDWLPSLEALAVHGSVNQPHNTQEHFVIFPTGQEPGATFRPSQETSRRASPHLNYNPTLPAEQSELESF